MRWIVFITRLAAVAASAAFVYSARYAPLMPFFALVPVMLAVVLIPRVRRWEQAWSPQRASPQRSPRLAAFAVFLWVSGPTSFMLATMDETDRGNGGLVSGLACLAAGICALAYAKFGPRHRWVLPTSVALLICAASWIECDRWWLHAIEAFHQSGLIGFVGQIDWTWPPLTSSVLLCGVASVGTLQWVAERRSGLDGKSPEPGGRRRTPHEDVG